jgi:hypothetical protein
MATKAIFKIYNDGKFLMGSWVKYDGGVSDTSIFPHFIKSIKPDVNKKSIYDIINKFVNDNKFRTMFGDNKKPFINQTNDEGMTGVDVLFWDKSISDAKLYKENVWGEYIYEVRFTKGNVKIKVIYNGNEKILYWKRDWGTGTIISTIKEVSKWIDGIEYGLNDCDCADHN